MNLFKAFSKHLFLDSKYDIEILLKCLKYLKKCIKTNVIIKILVYYKYKIFLI